MPTLSRILHWKHQQCNLRWFKKAQTNWQWKVMNQILACNTLFLMKKSKKVIFSEKVAKYGDNIKAGTASHTCASLQHQTLHWHITSLPIKLHINCNSLALRINITSKSEKHDALKSYMYLYRNMSISDIKHKSEIQLTISQSIFFRKSSNKSAIWRYFCWFSTSKTTWLCPSAASRQGYCNNCNLRGRVKWLAATDGEFMGDCWYHQLLFRILSIDDKTNLFWWGIENEGM